jgi:hypothetical protein
MALFIFFVLAMKCYTPIAEGSKVLSLKKSDKDPAMGGGVDFIVTLLIIT